MTVIAADPLKSLDIPPQWKPRFGILTGISMLPVVRIDYGGLLPDKIIEMAPYAEMVVAAAAQGQPKSLYTLTNLRDATTSDESVARVKATARKNKEWVVYGALTTGANFFMRALISGVSMQEGRILIAFTHEQTAKDWLKQIDPTNRKDAVSLGVRMGITG